MIYLFVAGLAVGLFAGYQIGLVRAFVRLGHAERRNRLEAIRSRKRS